MKWSFDDHHIGLTKEGGMSLFKRVILRSSEMKTQEWYAVAGAMCLVLNTAGMTLDDD